MIKPILLLAAFLTSLPAWSALTEPDQATLINTKNYATNGGAENGLAAWTVSGTSAVAADLVRDATNKYEGNAGFAWTPHNANNHLTNAAVTITSNQGLSGANCAAIVWTKTTSTTKTLEAYDGTNILATVTIPSSTVFIPVSVNWICSSSGTNTVRFGTGDTTVLYFDSTKWGDARAVNITQVSQAQAYGSIRYASVVQTWTSTTTSYGNFTANNSISFPSGSDLSGNASAPATHIPGITFSSLPPGEYLVVADGFIAYNTSANISNGFRFHDGTNAAVGESVMQSDSQGNAFRSPLTGRFVYTTAQSNVTFQVQSYAASSAGQVISLTKGDFVIRVYYYPSQSQTAYRPDQTPASWSGTATLTGTTAATGSMADPGSVSGSVTQTGTPRNITCTVASSLIGITCTLPRAGNYQVCYGGSEFLSAANDTSVQLTDGSNTVIVGTQKLSSYTNGASVPFGGCSNYNAAAPGSTTFKVRAFVGAGTSTVNATSFSVLELDAPLAAPYLTGSVTSDSTGTTKVHYAQMLLNGSTCNVGFQDGTWISSGSRPSSRRCTITMSPGFGSANYTCNCSPDGSALSGTCSISTDSVSKTSTQFQIFTDTTLSDNTFDIQCIGPR